MRTPEIEPEQLLRRRYERMVREGVI